MLLSGGIALGVMCDDLNMHIIKQFTCDMGQRFTGSLNHIRAVGETFRELFDRVTGTIPLT